MPKGHYERKPRAPEPEIKPAEADAELAAEPFAVIPAHDTEAAAAMQAESQGREPLVEWALPDDTDFVQIVKYPVAEPVALAVPPHDMVNFKVGMWAGSFCRGEHQVSWLPVDDGASLEVTLVTAHGTSTLKAPAGNWTEAEVDAALAQMRSDLRV